MGKSDLEPLLDQQEQELLDEYEAGKCHLVKTEARLKAARNAAAGALIKDKRINIRIAHRDLLALQRRAAKEGVPYQTLVSSILHKFVSGGWKTSSQTNRQA